MDLGKISEINYKQSVTQNGTLFLETRAFPGCAPCPHVLRDVVSPIMPLLVGGSNHNKVNMMQVQVVEVFNLCSYERVQADIISIFGVDTFY